ncbi:GNAT family N-acetyltransferase [Dactylosporangium vinaceum]|uniref:GNAT family N-acetyltransferase n=1 Tax=Dactylosporangium vinaceum TaxID=53362 RepID=A0ABV5M2Y5_9ACTN|nr:GNAT family N-acetyltransferase [Dactylosporangium vinaceum]UAB99848.1 GNAT family N-acetyltransferase [Dactylosporangium vinaceum]
MILDNPAWHSLNGPHARFAEAHGSARRYRPDVSVFVGLPDLRDDGVWSDLAALVGPGVEVPVTGAAVAPPADWEPVSQGTGVQMVDDGVDARPDAEAAVLTADDAEEMRDLVDRTKPGPWRARTFELGTYLGLRRDGRLVAMAGERLHPPGWTEISAVCTDPAHRGQGLAARLVRAVAYNIRSRGDQVLLHAAASNTDAIRLYRALGFRVRRETTFATYRTPAPAADPASRKVRP